MRTTTRGLQRWHASRPRGKGTGHPLKGVRNAVTSAATSYTAGEEPIGILGSVTSGSDANKASLVGGSISTQGKNANSAEVGAYSDCGSTQRRA